MTETALPISITSRLAVLRRIKPVVERVSEILVERAAGVVDGDGDDSSKAPKIGLTLDGVKDVLRTYKLLSEEVLEDENRLTELAKTVMLQLKFKGRVKSGLFGDADGRKQLLKLASALYTNGNEEFLAIVGRLRTAGMSDEQISESKEFKKLLPKAAELVKTFLTLNQEVGGQILTELFDGDYNQFRSTLSSAFAGEVPHENIVFFLFDRLNAGKNAEKIETIKQKIQEIQKIPHGTIEKAEIIKSKYQEILDLIFGKHEIISELKTPPFKEGLLSLDDISKLEDMMGNTFTSECRGLVELGKSYDGSDLVKRFPALSCYLHALDADKIEDLARLALEVRELDLNVMKARGEDKDGSQNEAIARLVEGRDVCLVQFKENGLSALKEQLTSAKSEAIRQIKSSANVHPSLCFAAGIDVDGVVSVFERNSEVLWDLYNVSKPEDIEKLKPRLDAVRVELSSLQIKGVNRVAKEIVAVKGNNVHPLILFLSAINPEKAVPLLTIKNYTDISPIMFSGLIDPTVIKDSILPKVGEFLSGAQAKEILDGLGVNPLVTSALPIVFSGPNGIDLSSVSSLLGIKLPGVEKTTSDSTQTSGSGPGWGKGFGKWIVGGVSSVIAISGLFVENSFGKASLLGLGFLGIGGAIASASESVRSLLGFGDSTPASSSNSNQDSNSINVSELADLAKLASSFIG